MPNLNGTGPEGKGPMTGGKRGNCKIKDGESNAGKDNERYGGGLGRGGRGRGMGRRFRNRDRWENSEE